jgi:methylglutaconyl-CoA hydratase
MANSYQTLAFEVTKKVCRITLNRPEVHNAFNAVLIEELTSAFKDVGARSPVEVRTVVLSGAGPSFCAGADIKWMRESLDLTETENTADALKMARMFDTINSCPIPVIGRVHGLALGGGVGLVAVCDVVVVAEGAVFAFSEAKLGIAPSVISSYVLAKIGPSHARALFLTAERFSAQRARDIGLVHLLVSEENLDVEVNRLVREVMTSGPKGVAAAKQLIATVPVMRPAEAMRTTVETIAALRVSPEGQEGLRAFIDKRKPEWATDASD